MKAGPCCEGCKCATQAQVDACHGHKGGRHVADILGRSVYVGDQVVTMVRGERPRNKWNVQRWRLAVGTVLAITDKRVRVDVDGKPHMVLDDALVKLQRLRS
jgi:hypothetical protein